MQIPGLLLLCCGLAANSGGTADTPAQPLDARADYRAFTLEVDALERTPPRTRVEIRAAAERLSAFDPETLVRGFILHHAFRIAADGPAPDLPPEHAPSALERLTPHLETATGAMARIETVLTGLGSRLTAPAQESSKDTYRRSMTGRPSIRGLPLFTQIVAAARRLEADGETTVTAGEEHLERCLRFARLNLRQCLAAAHFEDEEIFCAARHGFTETGACWGRYVDRAR